MGHGCWSADALTVSREWVTGGRLGSLARPPGFASAGRSLRCRRFGCVMLAGILRAHLARIHLGWRPWWSSRKTAPVVVGDRSALIRRGCSRDWRPGWPLSGAVGNQRAASPVNRPSGGGYFLTKVQGLGGHQYGRSLNAPSGARCFLTRISRTMIRQVRCLNAPSGAR